MNWELRATSWGTQWVAARDGLDFRIEVRGGYELTYRRYGDGWSHIGTFVSEEDAKRAAEGWTG